MHSLNRAVWWGAGLVIGAFVLAGAPREAEAEEVWSALPPLPEARAYAGVAPVGAGGVLVVGGSGTLGDPLSSAVVFDAASNTWNVQAVEAGPRIWPSVVPRQDGRALVVGGFTLDGSVPKVIYYTWGQGIYAPLGDGPAHGAMAWAEVGGGKIVFVGGYDSVGYSADTDVFNVSNNEWHTGASMSAPRAFAGAVTLPDGRVMVAGGCAQSLDLPVADATTEIYDPQADSWSPGPPMATARWGFASAKLPSGRWMVAGGVTTVNGEMVATDQVEIFDPVNMEWTAGPPLGTERGVPSFAALADGSLMVAGGQSGPLLTASVLGSAERFDEAAGAWASAGTMSSPRYWTAGARLSTGTFVVPGGYPSQAQDMVESVDLFVPDAVPCTTVADCPPASDDCQTVSCDMEHGVCKSTPKADGLPCDAGPEWCDSWTACQLGECVILEGTPCSGGSGGGGTGGSGGGGTGGSGGSTANGGNQAVAGGHGESSCALGRGGGGAASWLGAAFALAAITGLSLRRRRR